MIRATAGTSSVDADLNSFRHRWKCTPPVSTFAAPRPKARLTMLATIHLVQAFTVAPRLPVVTTSAPFRFAAPVASAFGRREFTLGAAALAAICQQPQAALAEGEVKTVVVAGATGQTGRRCLERLAKMGGVSAIGGVRNPEKVCTEAT